jgi:RNA polymerase sigma-70 factor (ECF subfamily)
MSLEAQIKDKEANASARPVDENDIIRRIAEGEKNLYALIIRKYNQRLYRIALAIINSPSDVPDVMQTAYIKTYENLDKFKFQSAFSTWITKILINESLMFLRNKEQSAAKAQNQFSPELYRNGIDAQTPLKKVLNSELRNILESAINDLPEKYRTVFVMRELEDMAVIETMECLGLSEANVKVRLNRAKVMLRNKLGAYLKDDGVFKLFEPVCDTIVLQVMKKIDSPGGEPGNEHLLTV